MTAAPGSLRWLLKHELRLSWRAIGGKRIWFIAIAGGALWSAVHFAAWAALRGGQYAQFAAQSSLNSFVLLIAGGVFWLFVSIMVSQTMVHAVASLFDRGDLDLLLSSPLSQRAIFVVRGLGIAISACLLPAFVLLPFAHAGVWVGEPGLLAIYPVVASVALGCAALGMLLTMSLVRLLGARRAKTTAQILAALIGAGFFLLTQLQNFLSKDTKRAIGAWLKNELQPGGWLGPESTMWWPVRAMQGEVLPLLLVMAAGIGGFWLVVNLTYRRFVTGTQETMTGGRTRARRNQPGGQFNFQTGLTRVLLFKEWKLIGRDPQLISQTLLQLLYLIPLLFIGFQSKGRGWLLVPGFVVISAMLAGNLAWLTIAAEDAPELVGTAPVPLIRVLWIKAAAAVLPVLALLAPLALWWTLRDPWAAVVLLLCSVGGMMSAAVVHIWNPRPGNRRDMKARRKQGGLANILEMLGSMGWAGIAVCLAGYWLWLPVALGVAMLGPGSAWLLGRAAREGR